MIKQSRGKLTDIVDYRTLLQIKKELKSSAFSLTHFSPVSHFYTP